MKKVLFRAPVLTASGYGVHSRQIAEWLLKKDIDLTMQVLPWGINPWYINDDHLNGLVGRIMSKTKKISGKFDISIQVQLPNEWDPTLAKYNVGVSAMVETDICNPEWLQHINNMDLVIVPSKHNLETIKRTGEVTTEVVVIPESYFPEVVNNPGEDLIGLDLDTKFNFLMLGQLTGNNPHNDRKNTFWTIRWLCEIFKDDKDVGVILKSNSGRYTHIDNQITKNMMLTLINEVRKGPYPKFYLLHGDLDDKQLSSLYHNEKVKAFVSLTRGEGFGLPILEAAVAGLPTITTNWSGHLDFLNYGKTIKINCSLNDIHESRADGKIFINGSKWAEPVEKDVKLKFKKFREKPNLPKQWAVELSKRLIDTHSHENICKQYDNLFMDLF